MARPKKNNADYFSHDNSMRNDDKIKAVRRKFWLEWYAIWCMILEKLTESDNFEIILDDISYELISWDFEISSDLLKNIVDYLILLKLLIKENNIIYSNWLKERLQSVIDKRNRNRDNISDRKRDDSGKFVTETDRNSTAPGISVTETPQSKVKESKWKEIKEKYIYNSWSEFFESINNKELKSKIELEIQTYKLKKPWVFIDGDLLERMKNKILEDYPRLNKADI